MIDKSRPNVLKIINPTYNDNILLFEKYYDFITNLTKFEANTNNIYNLYQNIVIEITPEEIFEHDFHYVLSLCQLLKTLYPVMRIRFNIILDVSKEYKSFYKSMKNGYRESIIKLSKGIHPDIWKYSMYWENNIIFGHMSDGILTYDKIKPILNPKIQYIYRHS